MYNHNEVPAVLKQKASSHQSFTDLSSEVTLTVPKGAEYALISATGAAVRWTDDGSTPSATNGHSIAADTSFFYRHGKLANIKLLESGTAAVCNVSYYAKPGN